MRTEGTWREQDNRNSGQMFEYLEARIETLKRCIEGLKQTNSQLRTDNAELRAQLEDWRSNHQLENIR